MDARFGLVLIVAGVLIAAAVLIGCQCGGDREAEERFVPPGVDGLGTPPQSKKPYDSILHSFGSSDFRASNRALALDPPYDPYRLSTSSIQGFSAVQLQSVS